MVVIVVIFVIIMLLVLLGFWLKLLGCFFFLVIVVLGIDLIWGYIGLLSLGYGIFFVLGGYGLVMYLKL